MSIYDKPPEGAYRCSQCDAHGCKLWRQNSTFLDHIELLCVVCAGEDQGHDIDRVNDAGLIPTKIFTTPSNKYEIWTDQIGGLVPAVPTNDGTFWGYTSVPADGVKWWRGLPSNPENGNLQHIAEKAAEEMGW